MSSSEIIPADTKNVGDVTIDYAEVRPKGTVAPKYMGTVVDQYDMSAMGRVQVLRVSYIPTTISTFAN